MSSSGPAKSPIALGDTLTKLTEMLDDVGGPVDRDRRRAAARISELVRTTDEDLARFAERHLPGRDVHADALKDAREIAVELARLIMMLGEAPEAATTLRRLKGRLKETLARGLDAPEGTAPALAPEEQASASPPALAAPPVIPPPPDASALPTFMQAPLASAAPAPTTPWPSVVEPPGPMTPSAPTVSPALKLDVPARTAPPDLATTQKLRPVVLPAKVAVPERPDLGGTQKLKPLPPGALAPRVLPFASPAASAPGTDAAASPESSTTALPFVPPPRRN